MTDDLSTQFASPPREFGPVPFWWWSGEPLDRKRLIWQLDQLADQGVAGVSVNYPHGPDMRTDLGSPPIFSSEWWNLWNDIADACRARKMTIGFSDYTLTWPDQGPIARDIIKQNPELVGQRLECCIQIVEGNSHLTIADKEGLRTLAVMAWPGSGRVSASNREEAIELGDPTPLDMNGGLDLGPYLQGGVLSWSAPPGMWSVVTISARSQGLDPTHPQLATAMIESYYEPFIRRNPELCGTTFQYFFQDELSFMPGGMPYWSAGLRSEFAARKGYDLLVHAWALWFDIGPITPKVRLDYYEVVVDLMERHYFRPIYEWHHSHGMVMGCDQHGRGRLGEGVRQYGDYFRTMRWFGAPGSDDPGNQRERDPILGKIHGSIAQLYGRSRVWLEGYHSSGWGVTPAEITAFTNAHFAAGFNLLNLHGLYYTTYGGWWEWAPPDFHFRQPYWAHIGAFNTYVARLSFLLSQGSRCSDVAILYPTASVQADPKSAPDVENACFGLARHLFKNGLDFDFVDDESLARGQADSGKWRIGDARYRVLVLPMMKAIRRTTLDAALSFKRAGGSVIVVGAAPEADDVEGRDGIALAAAIEELCAETDPLSEDHYSDVVKVIDATGPRDFSSSVSNVLVHHRRIQGTDVYYVYNDNDVDIETLVRLRLRGTLESWDAWTGKTAPLTSVKSWSDGVEVAIALAAQEAKVVVVRSAEPQQELAADKETTVGNETIASPVRVSSEEVWPLEGVWDFQAVPTLNNRWGDFRQPPNPSLMGPEIRRFRYHLGDEDTAEYVRPEFDDKAWTTYTYSFGPRFWSVGPLTSEQATERVEQSIISLQTVEFGSVVDVEGARMEWDCYTYSTAWGAHDDPHLLHWLTGPHGLKATVPNEFIVLTDVVGRDRDPLGQGGTWYLWTTVSVDAPVEKMLHLRAMTYTNRQPAAEEELPCYAWINGDPVAPKAGTFRVHLRCGTNRLVLRFQQRDRSPDTFTHWSAPDSLSTVRAYALLSDGSLPDETSMRFPLRWQTLPGLVPFDLLSSEGGPHVGWYRFLAPPGLRSLRLGLIGTPKIWVDGEEARVTLESASGGPINRYHAIPSVMPSKSACVVMRVEHAPGFYAGAAIPEAIQVECGAGQIALGDWSTYGLSSYSGGGRYATTVHVPSASANAKIVLDLGKVAGTVQVNVNGGSAGTLVAPPWKLDISGLLHGGDNEIVVNLRNTLANHYSEGIPTRYVYSGQTTAGLIGPVCIRVTNLA